MSVLDTRITPEGYQGYTQNEYHAYIVERMLEIDPNMNLSDSSVDGMIIAIQAELFARLDEGLEAAYNSKNPNLARDYELNVISLLTGKQRRAATASVVELTFDGSEGTVIPSGALFADSQDRQWRTLSEVIIGSSETGSAQAACQTLGAVVVDLNEITRFIDTIGGIKSVTNNKLAAVGSDEQSDESLRRERNRSVAIGGTSQVDAMYSHLYNTDGVIDALIINNFTNQTDVNGVPAHSIAVLVDGDDATDAEIALAIFRSKTIGCGFHGLGTPVTVVDVFDKNEKSAIDVTFGRAVKINMIITLQIHNDGTLPLNIDTLIKNAIVAYAKGELPTNQFNRTGYQMAEDVAVNQLITPINFELGQYGNSYVQTIDVNGYGYGGVVPISIFQKAHFDANNISIELTT